MESFECEEENFEVNAGSGRQPVELFEDGTDMMGEWSSGEYKGSRVLNHLEFM